MLITTVLVLHQLCSIKLCFKSAQFLSCLLILPQCLAMAVEVPFIPKQILIFGGNGFIGSSTAELLIEAGHTVTLVNRGNWYWDSAYTVKPFVHNIKCDRTQSIDRCTSLQEFVDKVEKLDAVIDFSAYHVQSIQDSLNILHRKTRLYIYISTDSIYEVCIKNHTEPTRESDAVRPESDQMRTNLQSWESYGHHKLQCEEYLSQFSLEHSGLPYVILRLPDVVGQRDNTHRWWIYQLWMKLRPFLEKDIIVPTALENKLMSLVYVKDVAEVIKKLVLNTFPDAYYQAFNLALKERFSLKQFLEDMRNELNLTSVNISVSDSPDAIKLFPSVRLGPVDTTKAEQLLQWAPANWKVVLRDTCSFYEEAIKNHYLNKPRNDVIKTLQSYLTSRPYDVLSGLNKVYGLGYPEQKDEL